MISIVTPGFTVFEALTEFPSIFTWPALQAVEANERVLKKRVAQSHRSIRTASRVEEVESAATTFSL